MSAPPPSSGIAFVGWENLRHDIYPATSAASTPSLKQPGKVVLITGASRGIGRAIALQYAHAGVAAIVLVARTASKLEAVAREINEIDAKIRVHTFALSVTDSTAVHACAASLTALESRLDILINNAGGSNDWGPLTDSQPDEWWACLELNVKGPYLFLHAFLPLMARTVQEAGAAWVNVVNMSSIAQNLVRPGASAYMVSKVALARLTEFVEVEWGGRGVGVVGVHPGGVATELTDREESLRVRKLWGGLLYLVAWGRNVC